MDDRTPPGERDVFNLLAGGPDDWVAIHSLDLAPWNRGRRTEIDFVVIDPATGILCVEVKSHRSISFDGDRWYPRDIKRSPFKQAADARFSLRRQLVALAPSFEDVPVAHCCLFTSASFDLRPNMSVRSWELIDGRRFSTYRNGNELCSDLGDILLRSIEQDPVLHSLQDRLSDSLVENLISCCLPVQRFRPDRREEIQAHERELDRLLREQQKPVLMLADSNPRMVVRGGAGTGKTLIAMELARLHAENGRRVALLCFNRLVGEWLQGEMAPVLRNLPNLVVGTAIRTMASMAGVPVPDAPGSSFWTRELPDRLEERMTDPDFRATATFDHIVVDEAQDLLARDQLWSCMQLFLEGGVVDGGFSILGDLENQVLGGHETMQRNLEDLVERSRPVRYALTENCRNYSVIGDTAVRLSGGRSSDIYTGYMRTGGSHRNTDVMFHESSTDQQNFLGKLLTDFRSRGYRNTEITILSFCAADRSAAASLEPGEMSVSPSWKNDGRTGFTSIHAFKGLENKVIILTDCVLGETDFQRSLFYTGMTRATEEVRVLCHASSRETLLGWLQGREVGE